MFISYQYTKKTPPFPPLTYSFFKAALTEVKEHSGPVPVSPWGDGNAGSATSIPDCKEPARAAGDTLGTSC